MTHPATEDNLCSLCLMRHAWFSHEAKMKLVKLGPLSSNRIKSLNQNICLGFLFYSFVSALQYQKAANTDVTADQQKRQHKSKNHLTEGDHDQRKIQMVFLEQLVNSVFETTVPVLILTLRQDSGNLFPLCRKTSLKTQNALQLWFKPLFLIFIIKLIIIIIFAIFVSSRNKKGALEIQLVCECCEHNNLQNN